MNHMIECGPAIPTGRRSFNTQVVFGTSFTFLTSGVFLSGLAMYMGASDLLVSYISMISNICGISILLFSSLIERFKSRRFLFFVVYIFLFYLMLSIADSFTVVYMMRYLKLSYIATTAIQMLISLPQIFLLGIWGKISDKRGHQFALTASIWFFIGETLFLALSNSHNLYIFIPAAFLFASVANAGFMVSVFNRRYELMPRDGRILFDNFFSAAVGLAFILGPVIGGAVKHLLESSSWVKGAIQFGNIRLLYVVSTVAIIILQILVLGFKSRGSKLTLEGGC